jgi:hypothetical protein
LWPKVLDREEGNSLIDGITPGKVRNRLFLTVSGLDGHSIEEEPDWQLPLFHIAAVVCTFAPRAAEGRKNGLFLSVFGHL